MKRIAPYSLLTIAVVLAYPASQLQAAFPDCQYADSDSDGDGWGWENHRSCIVSGSSASVAVANASTPAATAAAVQVVTAPAATAPVASAPVASSTAASIDAATGKPVCSSAAVDSDGDGWGWENQRSCIVKSSGASAAQPLVTLQALPGNSVTTANSATNSEIINGLYQGRHQICSSPSADGDGDGWGFEYHDSCKVIAGYVAPGTTANAPPAGNNPNMQVGVVYEQNFNSSPSGLYQSDQLNAEWQTPFWHLGFDQGRVKIIDAGGSNGKAMQVTYPAGSYGAGGASAFLSDIQFGMGLPKTYEELYVAYDIRFAAGFDFVKGGKLPGLCGTDINQASHTGCNTGGGYPTGYDGWSARGMWRENGLLENYIYHAGQRNYYGDDEYWNVAATPGVWHSVQHRIVLNTPGQKNGILEAWFDGRKVLSLSDIEYRKTNTIGINLFYFSTFFGGNDISWAPATDQTMHFDNFAISTETIH